MAHLPIPTSGAFAERLPATRERGFSAPEVVWVSRRLGA